MNLKNKTILITGASSGIGKALAIEFSKINCNLILTARRENLIHEYRSELQLNDANLLILKNDVSDKNSCAESYRTALEKFGGIDVAVLNAGAGHSVTVERYDSAWAERIYGANVFGIIYWVEQLLPEFIKRKSGIIAGVSSLADNRGFSGSGFYCSSKAAASLYLEGLRVELARYNIKVITVKPGFVKTPMTDKNNYKMPFIMDADKAAGIIKRGLEKEKRIIQFPWLMVFITRLLGLLPGNIYEFLAKRSKVK
jgi:short-subunit dehydrogenase